MSKREMILAGIVGSLILLLGIGYSVVQVTKAIGEKRTKITQLDEQIRQQKLTVDYGLEDEERIKDYRGRALPADVAKARSLYRDWLTDRAKEVGFHDPKVTKIPTRSSSKAYEALAYSIRAKGDLEQAIRFLHRFYSEGWLHRVHHLNVKRIKNSKQHDLTISVEALSLKDAESTDQLPEGQSNRLAYGDGDLDTYKKKILYRNFFGPPNNEPTLESIDEIAAYTGQTVEITVKGSDPDKLDTLRYELEGDNLRNARLDEKSGEFEWTPEKAGEYKVAIIAKDDGWPPKSASEEFTIKVDKAQEVKKEIKEDLPSFDMAKFAYVSGITETDGRKQAWIHLRTEGRMLELNEGDEFVIDEVKVTVRRILEPEKKVELEAVALKKRLLVTMGQNLAEGNSLPLDEG